MSKYVLFKKAPVQPGSMDSEAGVFAMAFDNSGTRLITAEADKTIKLYREDDTAVSILLGILRINDNQLVLLYFKYQNRLCFHMLYYNTKTFINLLQYILVYYFIK